MEELIMLCEIRGELSPEDNAKIEARIAEIEKELQGVDKAPHFLLE